VAERWKPWPVPEKFLTAAGGGGGWCVVLGEPNEKVRVGRQVGGMPTLDYDEAAAIAKLLNKRIDREVIHARCPNDHPVAADGPRIEVLALICSVCEAALVESEPIEVTRG
jgi:hypothetical protein